MDKKKMRKGARTALLGVLQARARSLAAQTCCADASARPKVRVVIKVGHGEMSYEAELLGSGEVDRLVVETTAAVFKELATNSCCQGRILTA